MVRAAPSRASLRDLLSHTCSVQALIALAWRLFRHRRTHLSVSLSTRIRSSQLRQAFDWARRGHRPKTLSNVNARSSPFRSRALRSQYKSYQVQKARLRSRPILYSTRRTRVKCRAARPATPARDHSISGRLSPFPFHHNCMHLWQSKAPRKCSALRCKPALTSPVHVTQAFAILCTIRATTLHAAYEGTVRNQASIAFLFPAFQHRRRRRGFDGMSLEEAVEVPPWTHVFRLLGVSRGVSAPRLTRSNRFIESFVIKEQRPSTLRRACRSQSVNTASTIRRVDQRRLAPS